MTLVKKERKKKEKKGGGKRKGMFFSPVGRENAACGAAHVYAND